MNYERKIYVIPGGDFITDFHSQFKSGALLLTWINFNPSIAK